MLEAVTATYDGKNFIFDEDLNLTPGQKVIITILKPQKRKIDIEKYAGSAGDLFGSVEKVENYIKELRDDREF